MNDHEPDGDPWVRRLGLSVGTASAHLSGFAAAKVLPGLIGIATVPFWTRVFGESAYGIYSVVWVAATISGSFFVGWIRQSLLRYAGNDAHGLSAFSPLVVAASVLMSVVPVAPIAIYAASGASLMPGALVTCAVAFAATNSLYLVLQANAQRETATFRYSIAEVLRALVALAASWLLWLSGIPDGALIMVASYLIATASAIAGLRAGLRRRARDQGANWREMWRYGWPLSIWLAMSQVLVYFDRVVIVAAEGAGPAGVYSATSDLIVRGISMVAFPITMLAHPVAMRAWNEGRRIDALRIIKTYSRMLWVVGGATVVPVALWGTAVVEWMLGVRLPSPLIVPLLALGAFVWQYALFSHKPLELAGRTHAMTAAMTSAVLVSVLLNLVLVPQFGMTSAAATFALSALLYVVLVRAISRKVAVL